MALHGGKQSQFGYTRGKLFPNLMRNILQFRLWAGLDLGKRIPVFRTPGCYECASGPEPECLADEM